MALDNSLIKKPHITQSYTNYQLGEFMKCADPDTGYLYFLTNYYYIQHPVKGKLLFEPFDYQLGLLESYHKNTLSINMLGRQLGKCVVSGTLINIKHRTTQLEKSITIEEFFKNQSTETSLPLNNQWYQLSLPGFELPSDTVTRKFIAAYDASEWMIFTDTGWEALIDIKKTIPYTIWNITLENGMSLSGADTHIVYTNNMDEIFIKDLQVGDSIITKDGITVVASIHETNLTESMYDVGVNSHNHRYYTNGILSHNTTCAAGYILWFSMFHPDKTILISAHKYSGAQEIMQRIRFAYEDCPDFIRAGVVSYNKGSIELDNGSRIVSTTTTENTGRGMSISLLYADELSAVKPNMANAMWTSISPTLATGGKAIITSTPNTDDDLFATLWRGANDRFDEYGNETILGKNGFFPYAAIWSAHPDRDEAWAAKERSKIGDAMFEREHTCLVHDTMINIQDTDGKTFLISIGDLYNLLE